MSTSTVQAGKLVPVRGVYITQTHNVPPIAE